MNPGGTRNSSGAGAPPSACSHASPKDLLHPPATDTRALADLVQRQAVQQPRAQHLDVPFGVCRRRESQPWWESSDPAAAPTRRSRVPWWRLDLTGVSMPGLGLRRALRHAELLVDTPNTVLRRLLGIDQTTSRSETGPARRAARGRSCPRRSMRSRYLRRPKGGHRPVRAIEAAGKASNGKLTEGRPATAQIRHIRWKVRAGGPARSRPTRRACQRIPRAIWEISSHGRQRWRSDDGETRNRTEDTTIFSRGATYPDPLC
jgi:hypothetical protein